MEKRGLLGAVAMAAVQNLHTIPSAESAAAEDAAGDNAAETTQGRRGEAAGRPAPRQAKAGGAAAAAAAVAPKASAAVAEMLTGASGCEDMDEIFKSLSAVLAEAQAESRQVRHPVWSGVVWWWWYQRFFLSCLFRGHEVAYNYLV